MLLVTLGEGHPSHPGDPNLAVEISAYCIKFRGSCARGCCASCLAPGALCGGERGKPLFYWGLVRIRGQSALEKYFFGGATGNARSRGREAERGLGSPWGCPPHPRTTNRGRRHRACAIDATAIAAGLEGYAFARVADVPVTPPPAGLRRRPRHESALRATRKLGKPLVEARKAFGPSSNAQSQHMEIDENLRTTLERLITTQGKSMETFGRHSNEQNRIMVGRSR